MEGHTVADYIEVEVNGETIRITPEIAQKYGERIPVTPAEYQKRVLGPISDKEWTEYAAGAPAVNGMPMASFSAMIRPIIDGFLRFRCQTIK